MRRSGHGATWTPMGSSWRCGSAWLSHQLAHRPVQPLERERIHATAHELAQHADRRSVVPLLLRDRIEPNAGRVGANDALQPAGAGLLVEMVDRAALRHDLVGRHRGIADEDRLVIVRIGVQHVPGRRGVVEAPAVLLPHLLVQAIVEVEVLHVLELAARGREQLLGRLDVPVHRAADVEEQQHLHRVVPLRPHQDVEVSLVRGALDGAIEVELLGRAGAGELAQAAQRELDVARAELDLVVEVLELALVPHLDGSEVAVLVLADAHPFGIVAEGAERRGAGGADPLVAALVAVLLLLHALAQGLEQLVQPAHRLDLLLLLLGPVFVRELREPLGRNLRGERLAHELEALEHVAEDAVELVEVALVLDQRGAREVVEVLDPAAGEILLHRLHQREIFAQRHWHAGGLELMEEGDEHGASLRHCAGWSSPDRRAQAAHGLRKPSITTRSAWPMNCRALASHERVSAKARQDLRDTWSAAMQAERKSSSSTPTGSPPMTSRGPVTG